MDGILVENTNLDRDMGIFRPLLIANGDEIGVRNGRRDVGKFVVAFFGKRFIFSCL